MNKKTEIFDKIDNKDSKEFIAEAVKIYKSYNDDLTKIIKSINEKKLSYKKNEIELALNFFLYDNEIHNISAKKKKERFLMLYNSYVLLASFQNCSEDVKFSDKEIDKKWKSRFFDREVDKKWKSMHEQVEDERRRLIFGWAKASENIKK
tara:strand:- start:401 stop:850 length:450 start_codon:yes stop_codon:yes gene_type:complete